jgi:hypothetical protein
MEQRNQEYPDSLSVVIPVDNEESTLSVIVRKMLKISHLLEIIVIAEKD